MRRETQNILLVLLGGALLKISFNGMYLRYVKPAQQPWLIAAGAVMVTLAAVSIVRDVLAARRAGRAPVEPETASVSGHREPASSPGASPDVHADAHADAHGHDHRSHSSWLLVLPVLAVFLIAPPSLGADSVTRAEGRSAPQPAADAGNSAMFPPLAPGQVVPMTMSDFSSRAAWDSANSLRDRTVRLVGFVVRQGADVYLARMAITCCAADAFPVKVKLTGSDVDSLANDEWVEVEAQLQVGSATRATQYVPTVTVKETRPVQEPVDPYEY